MRKAYLLVTILITFFAFNSQAQDTIMFKNGDLKLAKIIQIKSSELTYKDFQNLEGPDYIIKISKVNEIHFKNGFVQKYNVPESTIEKSQENVEYINDVPVKPRTELEQQKQEDFSVRRFSSYKEKRNYYKNVPYQYDYMDRLNPWLSSLASYFLPGLGQIVSGETGRGLAFMGGTVACQVVALIGLAGLSHSSTNNNYYTGYGGYSYYYYNNNDNNETLYAAMLVGGLISTVGVYIWNIVDAYQVAKINNLYARDLRKSHLSIQLSPSVLPTKTYASNSYAFGATLSIHL